MASCKPHQPPASPEPLGWDEKKRREGSDRKSEKDPDSTPPPKKKRTGNFTKPRSSPGCLFQSTTEGVTVNYQCASSTGQNVLGMVPRLAGLRNYSSASSSLPKAKVEEGGQEGRVAPSLGTQHTRPTTISSASCPTKLKCHTHESHLFTVLPCTPWLRDQQRPPGHHPWDGDTSTGTLTKPHDWVRASSFQTLGFCWAKAGLGLSTHLTKLQTG